MNSKAGWYWIAAGVLALGINSKLANHEFQVQSVVDRPVQLATQAADEVTGRLVMALSGLDSTFFTHNSQCPTRRAEWLQTNALRQQAGLVRLTKERIRIVKVMRDPVKIVICPSQDRNPRPHSPAPGDGDTI
jgi:hypothetical protein